MSDLDRKLVFRRPVRNDLVSGYQVDAMEAALGELGISTQRISMTRARSFVGRVAKHARLVRNFRRSPDRILLAPVLRRSEGDLLPDCFWTEIVPWSFDCWPNEYDAWEDFYRRIRCQLAFVSARDSAQELQRRLPGMRVVWSPEATDPSKYDPRKKLTERNIGVLELGRRYDAFHAAVSPFLESRGIRHVYEPVPGQKIFPTRTELAAGLGDSIISVCFPAARTHPEAAHGLSTATHRYFESIASKCILVGESPSELVDLFGYDPTIAIDASEPLSQLGSILLEPEKYQDLVDRNYSRLQEVGTWSVRAAQVLRCIEDAFKN